LTETNCSEKGSSTISEWGRWDLKAAPVVMPSPILLISTQQPLFFKVA